MTEEGRRESKFSIHRKTVTRVGQDRLATWPWPIVGYRWGTMTPGSVTEPVVTEQAKPQTAWKIELVSSFPGLTSLDRLSLGSRIFRIVGPPLDPTGDRMNQVLNVVELEFDEEANG